MEQEEVEEEEEVVEEVAEEENGDGESEREWTDEKLAALER